MREVNVHIRTYIHQQGQTLEQTCRGKRFPNGEGWYLVYKEDWEDGQQVATTIKMLPDKAVIIRSGAIRMRQEYEIGKWTEGNYAGPFGIMRMETKAEQIESGPDRFFLSYLLKLNGEQMGRYDLSIEMKDIG